MKLNLTEQAKEEIGILMQNSDMWKALMELLQKAAAPQRERLETCDLDELQKERLRLEGMLKLIRFLDTARNQHVRGKNAKKI